MPDESKEKWLVLDYSDRALSTFDSYTEAEEALYSKYLLSGYRVVRVEGESDG